MNKELNVLLEDIGSSYYRSGNGIDSNNEVVANLNEVTNEIAELNKKKKALDKLLDSNKELSEKEENIIEELNNIESYRKSIFQKIGLEIYGKVKIEDIPDQGLKKIFNRALEGERESENLEREIYKIENRTVKGNIISSILNPLKLSRLKNSLLNNNKKNLEVISQIGENYCQNEEHKELCDSVEELSQEFDGIDKSFKDKKSSLDGVKKKIDETSKKIISYGSRGKLETSIKNAESKQKELFIEYGLVLTKENGLSNDIQVKINRYISLKLNQELKYYKEELDNKNSLKEKLSSRIQKKKDELKQLEEDMIDIENELKSIQNSITSNQKALEDLILE